MKGTPYSALHGKSGVYAIRSRASGKLYIGSAVDLYKRFSAHGRLLRKGTHHNTPLQRAFAKRGEEDICFFVLVQAAHDKLLEKEQEWLDKTPKAKKYNILPEAGNSLGYKHTEETKQALSLLQRGNKNAVGSGGRKASPTEAEKAAISRTKKKQPYPKVRSPDGAEHEVTPSLNLFCQRHGLTRQGMQKLFSGQRSRHRGWAKSG
jgi:group I intron endonuclease